jgi:hypothetical protein
VRNIVRMPITGRVGIIGSHLGGAWPVLSHDAHVSGRARPYRTGGHELGAVFAFPRPELVSHHAARGQAAA